MPTQPLRWRGTAHQWRLAVVAGVALAAPVISGRPILIALSAPLLMLLAIGRGRQEPRSASLEVQTDTEHCYENEDVLLTLVLRMETPAHLISAEWLLPPTVDVVAGPDPRQVWRGGRPLEVEWTLRPRRWGRQHLGVRVRLRSAGRLRESFIDWHGELAVHPLPVDTGAAFVPDELLTQLGEHVSRLAGEGLQFAGIRPYAAGYRARRINWYVSSRYERLHVNTFAPERSANVVVLVDTFADIGPAGESSLDHSLRGATALVRAHLKIADRVGIVAIGGHLRWLRPDSTAHHYFRIADALLDTNAFPPPAGLAANVPRAALPSGALVVFFSPLLEPTAIDLIWSLSGRGHPIVAVDVLTERPKPPPGAPGAALALRLFELDREGLGYRLAEHGISVIGWDGRSSLRAGLAAAARRPVRGRTA